MSVKPHQVADFLSYARKPETWLFAARRQMAVAQILLDRQVSYGPFSRKPVEERAGCFAAFYLHAGLAIENAAKANLVYRDPTFIRDDGEIDRKKLGGKGGHGLVGICKLVLSDLHQTDYQLITKLQEYVVWLGKYVIPIDASTLYNEELENAIRSSCVDEDVRIRSLFERLLNSVPGR